MNPDNIDKYMTKQLKKARKRHLLGEEEEKMFDVGFWAGAKADRILHTKKLGYTKEEKKKAKSNE